MRITHLIGGGATALVARHLVRGRIGLEGPNPAWERTNFRGRTVSLAGGIQTAVTLCASALPLSAASRHLGVALASATGAAGLLGYADDCDATPGAAKGFRGHLSALANGEVTTGALKIVGIGAGAGVAAIALERGRGTQSVANVILDTALIASAANVANLLDLRPGRTLKAGALAAGALCTRPTGAAIGAACLTTALAELPADLAERHMLGDTGANALGAALGVGAAASLSRPGRATLAATLIAAMVASEKVSFSRVIAETPVLAHLDRWGRDPDA